MAEEAAPPEHSGVTYTYQGPDLRGHAEQLRQKRAEFLGMGGPERVAKQHADG